MRQSIHIFRKDAYHLRFEIALFLAVATIYALVVSRRPDPMLGPQWLVGIAAIFLIARVVHSEPIPGDDQFWVTRPYHRMSLAGAKLLFIVVFVCGPVCAAQIAMGVALGFPLSSSVPGLLWLQVLLFIGSLLVAAVAALTPGTVLFMFAVLLLAVAAFIAEFAFPFSYPGSGAYRLPEPLALEWVRQYFALAILAFTGAFIFHRQYRHRSTTLSVVTGAVGMCLAGATFLWLPSPFVYAVQSFVAGLPPVASSVQVSLDAALRSGAVLVTDRNTRHRRVRIPFPIVIRGLPEGFDSRVDAVSVSFEWAGMRTWKPDTAPGVNPRSAPRGFSLQDATVVMDPALYRELRTSPLTLTGAAYITLFGETETRTVSLQGHPANLQDGLRCFVGDFNYLICRSLFRWPARLIYAESAGKESMFPNTLISYSPFPADPDLSVVTSRAGGDISAAKLTLTTQKPLAHFWRRFQIQGIRLSEFEGSEPPPTL